MLFEVVNSNGLTILKTDNLKNMLSGEELRQVASYGYTFRLNGMPVSTEDAYTATVTAYFHEQAANLK